MKIITTVVVAVVLCLSAVPAAAQARPGNQRGARQGNMPAPAPGMPLPQLQAMFDAYVLVQAQGVLQLDDAGYQQFFPRMNRLQDLRRQHTQQRSRIITELRRQSGPGGADEPALLAILQRLADVDAQFLKDMQAARAAIDEVLSVRQRAAFRFFEEDMERRKIDFLTLARQGGRQGGGGPG